MICVRRIFKMNFGTLIKRAIGFEEIYTVLYRKRQQNEVPIYFNANYNYAELHTSDECWYADPLLFKFEANLYLFMESYEYKYQKGCIVYSVLMPDGTFSVPKVIIKERYHMSFPMVFEWNGDIYMMPETSENQSINIYKCLDFPEKWEKKAEIKTKDKLVDAIILEKSQTELLILASSFDESNPLKTKFQLYAIKQTGFEKIRS